MSQYPPNQPYPPHQPQQPGYPPPQGGYPQQGGYPPHGGYPPPQGGGYPPPGGPQGYGGHPGHQPAGTNGWGIASLITGLVGFCVPFLGGLLAMLFGFIGIAKARKVRNGMGLSVVGLILGLLSVGVYAVSGGAIWAWVQGTKVNRDTARQFITDLSTGNISAAQARTDGNMTADELQSLSEQLKKNGTVTDVTTIGFSQDYGTGRLELAGAITFGGAQVPFAMTQVKAGTEWKVSQFRLNPDGGTTTSGGGTGGGTTSESGPTDAGDSGGAKAPNNTTDKNSGTDDAAGER